MLTLKYMYGNSQNMITSYILLYHIKYWKQGTESDMHGEIDEDSNPYTNVP